MAWPFEATAVANRHPDYVARVDLRSLARRLPLRGQRTLRVLRDPGGAYRRDRLIRRLIADPDRSPTSEELTRLKRAWGGGGVADVGYMAEVCERARLADDAILECGSGLTTLLLGIYSNVPVWSLEEAAPWAARMQAALAWYRIGGVQIEHAPLVDHGGDRWYSVPAGLPPRFGLVVCDGPISHRMDGAPRYGLFPVLGEHLDPATVVLLDDVDRPTEAEALRRWETCGASSQVVRDRGRAFARVSPR